MEVDFWRYREYNKVYKLNMERKQIMIIYKQIYENNINLLEQLTPLWIQYMRELYESDEEFQSESDDKIKSWLLDRIHIQGQRDNMHFECVFADDQLIGFVFYAIDIGGIKGLIDAGYGYIMEMYVIPKYRKRAYGTKMYEHVSKTLKEEGALHTYLTPDSKSGVPFWIKMGFVDSGKIDPDNKMPIYIK